MRDAVIGGKYVSRTRAQAAVMNDPSNKDDVRTCVDGFPCVVFYRYSEDDNNWKFLGKYNFNNDKSTESVFGNTTMKIVMNLNITQRITTTLMIVGRK